MSEGESHDHDWKPDEDLGFNRYRCAVCTASGYRKKDGSIKPHEKQQKARSRLTARGIVGGAMLPGGNKMTLKRPRG